MSSDQTDAEAPLGRVAVLGLGVMGGSLCRALSDTGLAERVTGWSPEATEREAASTARAVDFTAGEWRAAVLDADLVVLALPLDATVRLLPEVGSIAPRATLTDVASLKSPVAAAARRAGLEARWVGSHPMAGSERAGFWASRSDLYEGARVWMCGARDGDDAPTAEVRTHVSNLWRGIGAEPQWVVAEAHDRLMSVASHLPQLVASALANAMDGADVGRDQLGPGGREMTRLAGSNSEMWRDLLAHADPALIEGLRAVARISSELAGQLVNGEVEAVLDLMREAGEWRRR